MTDRLRALDFVKEECPAIVESDEAGYLDSIDVLLEAIILHRRLEDRSMPWPDAQELILALAPLPKGPETAHIPGMYECWQRGRARAIQRCRSGGGSAEIDGGVRRKGARADIGLGGGERLSGVG